jgi:hypothetical protein
MQLAGADGDLAAPAAGAQLACRAGHARRRRPGHHDRLLVALPARGPGAAGDPLRAGRLPGAEAVANAALSYPAPALACAEVSSSIGLTSVIPKTRAACTISSANG